jgi:hypothetical protein
MQILNARLSDNAIAESDIKSLEKSLDMKLFRSVRLRTLRRRFGKSRGGGEWTIPNHVLKGKPLIRGARRGRPESRARESENRAASSRGRAEYRVREWSVM